MAPFASLVGMVFDYEACPIISAHFSVLLPPPL
jgi:hypothetical protein